MIRRLSEMLNKPMTLGSLEHGKSLCWNNGQEQFEPSGYTNAEIDALIAAAGGGGEGTVTSVALTLPDIFSVSGSPVTGDGTLAASLATKAANLVFAGPSSGGAAAPAFRSLAAADIPQIAASKIISGSLDDAVDIGVGTSIGTKLGTAVNQKIGFWNATPVVQPAHADQAAIGTFAIVTGDYSGMFLTESGAFTEPDAITLAQHLSTAFSDLANDLAALKALTNALRAAMVNSGLAKGSA